MNSPDLIRLAALLRDAGVVVGQAGSTVTRAVTGDDALRIAGVLERGGFKIGRAGP